MSPNIATIMAADLAATALDTTAVESPSETVGYKNGVAASVNIAGLVTNWIDEEITDTDGVGVGGSCTLEIAVSDIATALIGDVAVIRSLTFRVNRKQPIGGALWRLSCTRWVSREKHRQEYRQNRQEN